MISVLGTQIYQSLVPHDQHMSRLGERVQDVIRLDMYILTDVDREDMTRHLHGLGHH